MKGVVIEIILSLVNKYIIIIIETKTEQTTFHKRLVLSRINEIFMFFAIKFIILVMVSLKRMT